MSAVAGGNPEASLSFAATRSESGLFIYALHYYVVNGGVKKESEIIFTFKQ